MEKDYKLDKLQDEVDELISIIFEEEQEAIDLEASIQKLKAKLNLISNKDEIKTNAIIKVVKMILKWTVLGTISISLITNLLSFNILIPEIILIMISILKGTKIYNKETEEVRKLAQTDIGMVNQEINEKESSLYNINQQLKINEKNMEAKKQEIRYLTSEKKKLSKESNKGNVVIIPVIGSRILQKKLN